MRERFETIRELCAGRVCLDVGAIGSLEHHLRERQKWVLHHLTEVAERVVGIDLDQAAAAELARHGHRNIVCADAEEFAFTRGFDVIVAGELIEHLNNPGRFLRACRSHLTEDGCLVLTTPNAFSVNNLVKGLLLGSVRLFHEHVNSYTPPLLTELLRRHGLRVSRVEYFTERNAGLKNRLFLLLSRLRPSWSEGLLIVARCADSTRSHG